MNSQIVIAVDAMGGDHGPKVTVPASLGILNSDPMVAIHLIGDQEQIESALSGCSYDKSRLKITHTTEVVEMNELPSRALRYKKKSSMRLSINMVKEGGAQAAVSAGNTGALMATARFVLKTFKGIDRPGIISAFPTLNSMTRVIDLGANVDSNTEHLFQFALMGSVLASTIENKPQPTVGLLNIGEEEIKGNGQVKATHELMSQSPLINYVGYVEGDEILLGDVDVIVCDGFVGNVALKSIEGTANLINQMFKEAFHKNFITKLLGLMVRPIMKSAIRRFDPSLFNGASLLGLRGIVIKSHGGAKKEAFETAIREAVKEVRHDLLDKLQSKMAILEEQ